MKMIVIRDFQNFQNLDTYFSSKMVDVAALELIKNGVCKLIVDESINIEKEDDRMRLIDLLQKALNECREPYAKIKVID